MGQKAKNAGKKKQMPATSGTATLRAKVYRKLAKGDGFTVSNTKEANEALGELVHISNTGFFIKGGKRVKYGNRLGKEEYTNQTRAWLNSTL